MKPIRCYAGQFFGGYPYSTTKQPSRASLVGVKLVLDSVAADTATELELEDWHSCLTKIDRPRRTYKEARIPMLFRHKASADDSGHYFDFTRSPLEALDGIKVKTHTNCRPILYIE